MTPPERVYIHYHRPPDRVDIFEQDLIFDDGAVKITFARDIVRDAPLLIAGEVALETGSDVVWFTFPGAWHDIARFHRADGTFAGVYANVLEPCRFEPGQVWRTTDLFLDLWIPAVEWLETDHPRPRLLDEEELTEAVESGWISSALGERAQREAARLVAEGRAGDWPPPVVREWTREKALALGTRD